MQAHEKDQWNDQQVAALELPRHNDPLLAQLNRLCATCSARVLKNQVTVMSLVAIVKTSLNNQNRQTGGCNLTSTTHDHGALKPSRPSNLTSKAAIGPQAGAPDSDGADFGHRDCQSIWSVGHLPSVTRTVERSQHADQRSTGGPGQQRLRKVHAKPKELHDN